MTARSGRAQQYFAQHGAARFSLNADLLASTVTFPGLDQVIRGFIGLHDEKLIQTAAPYNSAIERKFTFDGVGRLWRQVSEPLGEGHATQQIGCARHP